MTPCDAPVAQLVERIHGKDKVSGSIPLGSSKIKPNAFSDAEVGAEIRAARSVA